MAWTRTADALPEPNVWLMGTDPGREYPMLVRLTTTVGDDEPRWETRTGDTTPLRACSHWGYFEPLEADQEPTDLQRMYRGAPCEICAGRSVVDVPAYSRI